MGKSRLKKIFKIMKSNSTYGTLLGKCRDCKGTGYRNQ